MSGVSVQRQSFDLTALILRGIVALDNDTRITSYIADSSFVHETNYDPHLYSWKLHLGLGSRTTKKYFKFHSLRPAAVAVHADHFIKYDLLDEQLLTYFCRLLPLYIVNNSEHPGMKQVQTFVNICLDYAHRENLEKLKNLICSLENIREENVRRRERFKKFLDGRGLMHFSDLQKFNTIARQLGVRLHAWGTTDYITLDNMLQEMIIAVDDNKSRALGVIVDYVEFLEQFLLLPINEAIKPIVDPNVSDRSDDAFYVEFYKLLRYSKHLDEGQEYFMLPPKKQSMFQLYKLKL